MTEKKKLGPASSKQAALLKCTSDIVCFGGAAGSGKSYLGVMAMLKWVHLKGFRGVIVRRTMTQITGPGGVSETAQDMYKDFGAEFKSKDCKFVFPQYGSSIVCKGCEQEKDKYNFQGWQVSAFLVDEAQQFEESQIHYFISRMRTEADMKTQMIMTANPLYGCYLHKWLNDAGYLDEEGMPIPEMDGVETWFVRSGNTMVWAKTREDLLERFGENCGPMSFCFLPATCRDNPILLERDKTYLFKLQNLPRVERLRLLDGCWNAREISSTMWQRTWIHEVDTVPIKAAKRVRSWDLSAKRVSEMTPNPDYTAGVLLSRTRDGEYTIEHVKRLRGTHGEVLDAIINTAIEDGPDTIILVPKDPGVAGSAYAQSLIRSITEAGFRAIAMPVAGRGSKSQRFGPFAAATQAGIVHIIKRCVDDYEHDVMGNNDTFYDELEAFDGSRGIKDDMVDAVSDAFTYLAKGTQMPTGFLSAITSPTSNYINPLIQIK